MARQVLPIVGAVIGAYFGNPQLGYMIGSLVGNAVDPEIIKGPRIGDVGVQTSRDGVPRPIVYGTAPVVGNVIDRGQYVKTIVSEQQGKGGPVVESERLSLTFAIRICEGPIAGISRVWEDEKLVYDVRLGSTFGSDSTRFFNTVAIYLGTEAQMPDPDLEAIHGAGTTPAYRGTAYIVFRDKDLTERRGSIPNYRFEVATDAVVVVPPVIPGWMVGQIGIGNDQRIYSTTGNDWEIASVENPDEVTTYDEAQYLNSTAILSNAGSYIYTSTDKGTTWVGPTSISPANPSSGGGRMCFTGGYYFIACGVNYLARSADLVTWEIPLASGITRADDVVAIGGLVAVASRYSAYLNYSDDLGESFTQGAECVFASSATVPDGKLCLATDQSLIVFFGRTGAPNYERKITWSDDNGENWTLGTDAFSGNSVDVEVVGLKYSHGRWVAVSSDGSIKYSLDGKGWGDSGYVVANPTDIDADGAKFIIVGGNGLIITSVNGLNWTEKPTLYNYDFKTVVSFGVVDQPPPIVDPGVSYLDLIVTDVCRRNGIDSSQIDVSELTDQVAGFVIGGAYDGAECIRSLQRVYFFDVGEWDAYLNFPKRGGASVITISEDDMLDIPDDNTREQELEFPKKLHLAYQNAELGYAPTRETVSRSTPDLNVVGESTVEVPVVLNADQAAQVVDKLMKVAWVDTGGESKFSIPDNFCYLTPTDCVNLNVRGRTFRVRIERIDTADGVLTIQSRRDRISSYISNALGERPRDPLDPVSSVPGETYFEFMNIPALIDADDRLGYYVAGRGELSPWQGYSVERSTDGGANFSSVLNTSTRAKMGSLTVAFADASEYVLDTTNVIRFQMYGPDNDDMPSITYEQLLSEGNACLVGDEIIQYQTAVEESPGIWALSNLLRGRLATATTSHAIGERFVFLSGANFIECSSVLIGQSLTHRATSFSNNPADSPEQTDIFQPANSQIELAPEFLQLERSLSNVITATWVPRYRFGSAISPIQSVNDRGFRVSLSDGVSTVTLPDQAAAFVTYDASLLGPSVTVTIQPINRLTGNTGPNVSGVI